MSLNVKCPKCGSTKVQLSCERSKHGCLFTALFGLFYIIWFMFRCIVATALLLLIDWWMAIIKACNGKGYVWKSRKWISNNKRIYYCHSCGYNFRG